MAEAIAAPIEANNIDAGVDAAAMNAAAAPAPGADLWLIRREARLKKLYRHSQVKVCTIKFKQPTIRKRDELKWMMQSPISSPYDAAASHEADDAVATSASETEVILSLDADERQQVQEKKEVEEAKQQQQQPAVYASSSSSSSFDSASSLDSSAVAGSLPAIVIDPFCALLSPEARPHLVALGNSIGTVQASRSRHVSAPAIWGADYTRHMIRCILADGQSIAVAGGGNALAATPPRNHYYRIGMKPVDMGAESKDSSSNAPEPSPVPPQLGWADGTGTTSALFNKPRGLALHPITGEMFLADSANHCIRVMTAPTVVGNAVRRAVKAIENESSFRALRDPTLDPVEEEERERKRLEKKQQQRRHIVSSGTFPSEALSHSLSLVCSLFLPTIMDYVGQEVRTIAGTPGTSGKRDTRIDPKGNVTQAAQFKFPFGLCLRMIGEVEDKSDATPHQKDSSERADEIEMQPIANESSSTSSSASISSNTHLSSPSSSYELLVSDAGNGCIRRVKPNPFQNDEAGGFIVETIRAFVPIRCCHTSWNSSSSSTEEQKEQPEPSCSPKSSFLDAAAASPSKLLLNTSKSSDSREYIKFKYPIGIALRIEKSRKYEWQEEQAEFGTVYTMGTPVSTGPSPTSRKSAGPATIAVTASTSSSTSSSSSLSSSQPLPKRVYASRASLIIVDARANSIYALDPDSGCVKLLAGDSDEWGYMDGGGGRARFCRPSGVAVDQRSGQIFVADAGNSCVRVIAANGTVTTLVGHPHRVGCNDGPMWRATLFAPLAIALSPCPFFPTEHEQMLWVAGGFRQGLRKIIRCGCEWTYDTD